MIRRVFVDCDVVLDLLLAREPHFAATTRLFNRFEDGSLEGHLSSLVFSNLFYVLRKHGSGREAIRLLRKLRLLITVVPVDAKIVDLALASSFRDFEDAVQYYAALTHGLDALITRNKKDYSAAKLLVYTAEECLAALGG